MSRQFATMINSGLSLLRALRSCRSRRKAKSLRGCSARCEHDVEAGTALSVALAKHPRGLPAAHGQHEQRRRGRRLPGQRPAQVAENYESEVKLRGKIKSAMTYPVIVFVIAILACASACCCSSSRSSPKMFKSLGGKLPLPTQLLVDTQQYSEVVFPVPLRRGHRLRLRVEEGQARRASAQRRRSAEAEAAGLRKRSFKKIALAASRATSAP